MEFSKLLFSYIGYIFYELFTLVSASALSIGKFFFLKIKNNKTKKAITKNPTKMDKINKSNNPSASSSFYFY